MRSAGSMAVLFALLGCASDPHPTSATRAPELTNDGNVLPFAARTFAGAATHMVTNAAGESVVVGIFSGSVDYGLGERESVGGGDLFVVKLDANGALQWHTTLGTEGEDEPAAAVLEDDGSVTILAAHAGLPGLLADPRDPAHTFMVRVASGGQVLEERPLVGVLPAAIARWTDGHVLSTTGGETIGVDVAVAHFGEMSAPSDVGISADRGSIRALATNGDALAIAGNYGGTARALGTSLPIAPDAGFVAALARPGVLAWSRVWPGATLRAARFASDGELLVGGSCAAGCAVPANEPDADVAGAFVAALDVNGHVRWSRRFPGRFGDGAIDVRATVTSIVAAPDGTVHAAGPFDGRIDFGDHRLDPIGSSTFHVVLDHHGRTAWSGRYAAAIGREAPTVTTDAAGHVFVASSFRGSIDLHITARSGRATDFGWFFARVTD